jgi:AraC family transcriptional regulator of adaptative response / DNA-3-methyladenine glycosylase II
MFLAYEPPYNWEQVRDFFAKRQIHGNELVSEAGLTKILTIPNEQPHIHNNAVQNSNHQAKHLAVSVSMRHAPEQSGFYLSFHADFKTHTQAIISIMRRMFDLDANPPQVEQALLHAGLVQAEIVSGLRIPGVASEFEAGCRAVLGQQVSVAAAINKVNQLHAHFAQLNCGGNGATGFPSPEDVAKSDLLFLKMPAARRQTLIQLANFYANKPLHNAPKTKQSSKQKEKNTPLVENDDDHHLSPTVNKLIDIKGIGPWTVSYIDMRARGQTDIWLDTDLIIKKQAHKFGEQNRPLQSDKASPWRSYLTLNLWSLA